MTFKELYLEVFRRRGCSEVEIARLEEEMELFASDVNCNYLFNSEIVLREGKTSEDFIDALIKCHEKLDQINPEIIRDAITLGRTRLFSKN